MKKTIAALGASVLGLGTVAIAGSPAAAAPPTEACTDMLDQIESTFTVESEDWFQDCVPQYGVGKAEFTIVPDESNPTEEFPEEFEPLSNFGAEGSGVEATSTLDLEALNAYLNVVGEPSPDSELLVPPIAPMEPFDVTATSHSYISLVVSPVATIGAATEENTPDDVIEACDVNEESIGWVATFDPIDTTFSQTIDGEAWNYTITGASKPTFFFIQPESELPVACVTDGEYTIAGDFEFAEEVFLFALVMPFIADDTFVLPVSLEQVLGQFSDASAADLNLGDVNFAELGESGLQTLGVFSRDGLVPTPPGPQLAATGADASSLVIPAVIVGGVVLLGGALVTVSIINRRRKNDAA